VLLLPLLLLLLVRSLSHAPHQLTRSLAIPCRTSMVLLPVPPRSPRLLYSTGSFAYLRDLVTDRPADDALIASLLAKVQSSLSAHGIAFETHPEDTDVVRLLEAQALKGDELSFYYVNLAAIVRKYEEWVRWLPRVRPFYGTPYATRHTRVLLRLSSDRVCGLHRHSGQVQPRCRRGSLPEHDRHRLRLRQHR